MTRPVLFLVIAVAIATACFLLLGGLLLPALGVEGMARTAIAGGVSGGLIAVIYFNMFRKSEGA